MTFALKHSIEPCAEFTNRNEAFTRNRIEAEVNLAHCQKHGLSEFIRNHWANQIRFWKRWEVRLEA